MMRRTSDESVASTKSTSSLSNDNFYEILYRLDGTSLASAACVSSALWSIAKEEKIWGNVCYSMWPSTNNDDVRNLISTIGGFRKFYADCFPLIANKDLAAAQLDAYIQHPEEWVDEHYYGELEHYESISPSDYISIIDVKYNERTILSKVLWGIPDSEGSNRWFYKSPFCIDLVNNSIGVEQECKVNLTVADGLPAIQSIESEKKEGKLWKHLDGIRLSWIIVNRNTKQAANFSSYTPLGIQRHWPTDKDFTLRFGSVLPANDILPCQLVECILVMKFQIFEENDTGYTSLKLTELSMQLEDIEGAHVNGEKSLMVLKEAMNCRRSKNYSDVVESCGLYSKLRSEIKEEKLRNENRTDTICILSSIAAVITFWYCI